MTTYIVVADAARARIFTRDALNLAEQESLVPVSYTHLTLPTTPYV